MNTNPSIYFLCPDTDIPSGGINVIYRLADVTRQVGHSTYVLHEKEGFINQWSPIVPQVRYWGTGLPFNQGDIVVIPETEPQAMSQLPDTVLKIVLSLSWSYIYENLETGYSWPDYGVVQAITNSNVVRGFIEWAMDIPVFKINVPVDHDIFHYDPEAKENMITYMAHRNNQGSLVEKIFQHPPRLSPVWKWSAINNLPLEKYAEILRRSNIFVTTGLKEGMPGPILEAMAAGAIIVGYGGVGGNEYIVPEGPDQNAFKVENHDYASLCRKLELVMSLIEYEDPIIPMIRKNALDRVKSLTFEAEKDSLKEFWDNFIAQEKPQTHENITEIPSTISSDTGTRSVHNKNECPSENKLTPRTKLFISEDQEIMTQGNAERMLQTVNDKKYLSDDGVILIDRARWETAQRFEDKCQMTSGINNTDDRNNDHQALFHNYDPLAGKHFRKVIELGCGPFTNIRNILQKIETPDKITLLDPLINNYLDHPHCAYQDRTLKNIPVEIISSTIEEFVPSEKYDLVIMINVLEHCFNVPIIFETIINSLEDSGCFIFADKVLKKNDISILVENQFDAGHPIKVSDEYINNILEENFHTLFRKDYYGLYDQEFRIDPYFIGSKTTNKTLSVQDMAVKKAEDLFSLGFIESAERILNRIVNQGRPSAACFNDLGFIAYQDGRVHEAVEFFVKALEIDENYFEAIENIGKCYQEQGNFQEAIKWQAQALEQAPEDTSLLNSLGNSFIQAENFPRAREVYERSIQIDDNQENIRLILMEIDNLEKVKITL